MNLQYKHVVAIIYTIILFLDRQDLTMINITLPTVATYFSVPIVATEWVSMAFLLALAVSIPISSWLGDRFGPKKIYIAAICLFGFSSILCALVEDLNFLISLRFVQGIGGGILMPVGMTMLYHAYDKAEYASITSFTFLPSLIAPAISPFLGGILLDYFGWRFVFLFSGPICLILAIFGFLVLKEETHRNRVPLDWIGFFLSSFLLIDTFYILSLINKLSYLYIIFILFIVLLILIFLFIWWEKRVAHPLVNLSFFNVDIFVKANLIQLCFQSCHFGAIFLFGMYLQVGVGMSASVAGLIMGMQAFGAMTTSRYSVYLFNLYGPKTPLIIGLTGVALLSPCIMLIQHPSMIAFGIFLFFIRGIFSGLCGTPIQTLSVIGFSKENLGQINSIFNACRQIAISLGVSISSIFISVGLKINRLTETSSIQPRQAIHVFGLGFFSIFIIAIIGILISNRIKACHQLINK
ncbi:MAG: MFS transporter [Alphaproteobacteria bacterium]|nr:MFS transporter [Alphaproteobacteria bacterium]